MGDAAELQSASQGLAGGVALIALFLGLRQWYEHRARWDLAEDDDAFYRRQDVRRWLGVVVLASLAVVVFVGSWVHPRIDGKGNPAFVVVWLVVLAMIVLTLVVALWDWVATWRFARVKRRQLLREHAAVLRQHLKPASNRDRTDVDGAGPEDA